MIHWHVGFDAEKLKKKTARTANLISRKKNKCNEDLVAASHSLAAISHCLSILRGAEHCEALDLRCVAFLLSILPCLLFYVFFPRGPFFMAPRPPCFPFSKLDCRVERRSARVYEWMNEWAPPISCLLDCFNLIES